MGVATCQHTRHIMPLVQICCVHRPNQIWNMKHDGDWVTFRHSQDNDKCLDFDESNNHLQIYRHKHMGNSNQKWKLVGHGSHTIIQSKEDKGDEYCFTCGGGDADAGSTVMVRKNTGADFQKFTIKNVAD